MEIQEQIDQDLPYLYEIRHKLHQNPELGHCEIATSELIRQELKSYGVEILEYGLTTGVVGIIRGQLSGECIALRADIDALPIQEQTALPFASRKNGISHACGHDIHTTALLGCAKTLSGRRDKLHGSILLIFQCAEETCDGAATMLEQGVLSTVKAEALIGLHCAPALPVGKIGVLAGTSNASCDTITIEVKGKGGHGAHPYLCVDPITVSAYLLTQLQTIVSRENRPTQPAVLTFGQINGGTAPNIIPDMVTLKGTLRTFDESVRQHHLAAIKRLSANCCEAMRASCEIKAEKGMPPLINTPDICEAICREVEPILGKTSIIRDLQPSMGSDDFSCLQQACGGVGVQFLVGTQIKEMPETGLGLHVAENIFPDEAIKPAVLALVAAVKACEN
ncbi:M20 metallopeptidase family protein [Pygmaiobacter massiliensis]|uniref:M20 metallopeptidase family protein n=1 Tax=Pygmaiobacter massiliensis TaxID=1917873 RepID=UPI000C7BDECB|nr:M20 family metallopeptidase [Pygmaiobacter massiliensis]